MPEVGFGSLAIIPSFKGFQGQLESGSAKAMAAAGVTGGAKFGDAAGQSAGKRFAGKFKTAVKAGLVGLAGLGVVATKFGLDAIGTASDLSETVSKSNVIFGKNAKAIRQWSKDSDKAMGLSQKAALDNASAFGDMFKQIGFNDKATVKMSKNVVQMASDFASFNNLDTEDVLDRISASMRGEYDSLQAIIPNISAARVEQQAMAETGKKNADALTAQEKAHATLAIIQHDGARAMGDFQRTSGGLANQQRILAAQFDNAKAKLGRGLLPIAVDVTKYLNEKGVPAFERFADWFTEDGIPAIKRFSDKAKPFIQDVLGEARDILRDAEPYAKGFVKAFNNVPDGVKKGLGAAALLGYGASKIPGGKASLGLGKATGKGLLGLVTKSKPLPVYVVNQGFGGPGGGGGKGIPPVAAAPTSSGGWKGLWNLLKGTPEGLTTKGLPLASIGSVMTGVTLSDRKLPPLMDPEEWERRQRAIKGMNDSLDVMNENLNNLSRRHKINLQAPGMDLLVDTTKRYKGLLDGLDNRHIRVFVDSVMGKNDIGESGDARFAGRGGVTVIHNGDIKADDPRAYLRDAQRRSRHMAGGGVNW